MLRWVTFHCDLGRDSEKKKKKKAGERESRKFARMLWEDAHPLKHQMLLETRRIDKTFHSVLIYVYF